MSVSQLSLTSPFSLLDFLQLLQMSAAPSPTAAMQVEALPTLLAQAGKMDVLGYGHKLIKAVRGDLAAEPAIVSNEGWRQMISVSGLFGRYVR